jgi:dTDP-4-amino-4,6-dideoxygalactose transaminase
MCIRDRDSANEGRRQAAELYGRLLEDLEGITAPQVTEGHVFHQYTIRIHDGRRDEVRAELDANGIGTMVYYPTPIHRLPVYAACYDTVHMPVAEAAAGEVLSLPIWPGIPESTQQRVVDALARALPSS